MAVFTKVSLDEARGFLARYDLGHLQELAGIASGIENTNYFVFTSRGDYVLTVFEKLTREQLPFYVGLMAHLAERGVAVPAPQAQRDGTLLGELHGKPCILATRLAGHWEPQPQAVHCRHVGRELARMHLAGADFSVRQPNLRGLAWWVETAPAVLPFLASGVARLLADEVQAQQDFAATESYRTLPAGPAHCDLFRDNVLFDEALAPGFIDFYFAGCDTWLFDLAVTVNDWCLDAASGEPDAERSAAMLQAYAAVRPFTPAEHTAWPLMLRAAALRFWMSRLYDYHLPRPAETLTPKDPVQFERILRVRRERPPGALPGHAAA
jgi:homoserine kinase type II